MKEDLPSLDFQRRKMYRTDEREVFSLFRLLNREIFNNKLPTPELEVVSNCREYWGFCEGAEFEPLQAIRNNSNCLIRLSDKWYCKQWLVSVLAHEMCHQHQWDVYSKRRVRAGKSTILSHGPSFFQHRTKLYRHGISLKTSYCPDLWFTHQDFFKC